MRHSEHHNGNNARCLSLLCRLLGYTRQAYYGYEKDTRTEALQSELIIQEVIKIRGELPKVGTRKLEHMLSDFMNSHRIKIGRDALFDLLRANRLLVRKRHRRTRTTNSAHWFRKYKNLIRGFVPQRAGALWVSDITYIVVADGFAYLSLITDAYSRKVVGYCLWPTLDAQGCVNALRMALAAHGRPGIHHSDRGIQYCCAQYVDILLDTKEGKEAVAISMTENGDPLENAIAERVNGILKDELLEGSYHSFEAAQTSIGIAISIYNNKRPHSSCDMLTPDEAHGCSGELRRRWKSYYPRPANEIAAQKEKEVTMSE